MKLATFVDARGVAAIGCVDADARTVTDLQAAHRARHGQASPLLADMLALIDGGDAALHLAHELCRWSDGAHAAPLAGVRLLAPVPVPRQIRDCNNFAQHMRDARIGMARLQARLAGAAEPPRDAPQAPIAPVNFRHIVFYISNRFNVVGPDCDIEWPAYSDWLDYEGEFGIFIGRRGRNIRKQDAYEHVFGYAIFNDFSARDQQAEEMEGRMGPTKGKSFDTGNAIGPWIVTRDEIPDPRALTVTVRVNGQQRARAGTEAMIHGFDDILAYISRHETLHPGEFIGSGTIGGCCGLETDHWLKDGDVVEIEVDRIGVLRNRVTRQADGKLAQHDR